MIGYFYIFLTILLTVYGQLVLKWQVNLAGSPPSESIEKFKFFVNILLNPWIISSLVSAFLAALSWMAAMTKFTLSYAYPFTSLSFVLVLLLSSLLFKDAITLPKLIGIGLVVAGVIVGSQQ